jgi:predicted acyltransferase
MSALPSLGQARQAATATEAVQSGEKESGVPGARLLSLDAFRGLTILGMLLVNNIALDAETPAHLTHANWSGRVHFADMVFPWFLFIVGVAVPYAAASHRKKGLPPWHYGLRVLGRAATLFLLGCFLDSTIAHRPVLGLGVLQLIGLTYLMAAMLVSLPIPARAALAAGLLLAHWSLIRFAPVPGVGAGQFTEEANVIRYLNETYLAPLNLKGLLSVIPATALALIGTMVGDLLRRGGAPARWKVAVLIAGGVILVLLGLAWSLHLPMNKPLWTASYILYTAGWGAAALGSLYGLIDVAGLRAWALPLIVPGTNAIVAYVAPILVKVNVLQAWTWTMPDGSHLPLQQALQHGCYVYAGRVAGGWLYTLAYISLWWLILFVLYRKRIFLRV